MFSTTGNSYDLLILGGGSGGYAAALRATGPGLSVAPADKTQAGDACCYRGRVPTKALPHTGAVTITEAPPHLAPMEDDDVSGPLERAFRRRGVTFGANIRRRPVAAAPGHEAACMTPTQSMGEAHPALTGKPLHAHD